MKIVVTSGEKFTDIDVLACATAYTELLQKEGKEAEAVLAKAMNKSVTHQVRSWQPIYATDFSEADQFVIVDTSHPKFLSGFVDQDRIVEIYDHHAGFTDYWQNKLGQNCHIDMIGACATLIWEEYQKRIRPVSLSSVSANLLLTAIISNTLNFGVSITDQRDKQAYQQLLQFTKLPKNWIEIYFEDQEKAVLENPINEIKNDTHVEVLSQISHPVTIGQIELWDSRHFIEHYQDQITQALRLFGNRHWFLTSPSISEGKNYLYTQNEDLKKLLSETIGTTFNGDLGITQQLWLRKEIINQLQN